MNVFPVPLQAEKMPSTIVLHISMHIIMCVYIYFGIHGGISYMYMIVHVITILSVLEQNSSIVV